MSEKDEGVKAEGKVSYGVLPQHYGGGPHGLGDPDDYRLRKVEREILIPKLLQQKTKELKCVEEVKEFAACSKRTGIMLPFKCQAVNQVMKECLYKWYKDPEFLKEVTDGYLKQRSEYRRTGIPQKMQRKESATF